MSVISFWAKALLLVSFSSCYAHTSDCSNITIKGDPLNYSFSEEKPVVDEKWQKTELSGENCEYRKTNWVQDEMNGCKFWWREERIFSPQLCSVAPDEAANKFLR